MIENLLDYLSPFPEHQKLNHLREYLQWLILKAIDEHGFGKELAFVGGTALRVIYKTNRFSEDLDFSLIGKKPIDSLDLSERLKQTLTQSGLQTTVKKMHARLPLASFFLGFQNLLYALKLSPQKGQSLSIKIEIDMNPPRGAKVERYLFADPIFFWVNHPDMSSLFSTKLHALFFRGFDKGRDFYDLIFFLRKKVQPSLKVFQNAAHQTHPKENFKTLDEVWKRLQKKVAHSNFELIRRDVRPFLLMPEEEKFLNQETILQLIQQDSQNDIFLSFPTSSRRGADEAPGIDSRFRGNDIIGPI